MKSRREQIEAISSNFSVIKRAFASSHRFTGLRFGITMTQASVLLALLHEGRKTMGQMTETLGVSKGATTQLLDGLIELGCIERTIDDDDRRVVYVDLSGKGKSYLEAVRRESSKRLETLFGELSDIEIQQMGGIINKLSMKAKELKW